MRYLKTRPSGKDKDINVFEFALGREELRLLYGVIKTARENLPDLLELMPARTRLRNFQKVIGEVLEQEGEFDHSKTNKIGLPKSEK